MKRKAFPNMKISKKISLTHSFIFLVLQIAFCFFLLIIIRLYYPIEATGEIRSLAREISFNVADYSKVLSNPSKQELIPVIPSKYRAFVIISDLNGKVLLKYGEENKVLDTVLKAKVPYNKVMRKVTQGTSLVYFKSIIKTKEKEDVLLQIAIDITQHLYFNTTLFKIVLILTVIGFSLSFFTGSIVGRVALQPITKIINTAQGISADSLALRIETSNTKDELYELSTTINDMIARLQTSFEKQEQLISDVSHELKTPISVVQGYVSLLDRWGKDDPDILQEAISRIRLETKNMADIVEDLLLLARKDNGTLYLDKIRFDISELIEEIVEDTKTIDSNCDILVMRNDVCHYIGDYRLMKQMLRIIIDNSMKYSDSMCKIRIWAENQESYFIMIEDSGIGIANNDLEKIFDRFYRADKARNRNKGGTGLGLSIAKAIANAHNGRIRAESELGKGTKITIELPHFTIE